MVPRAQRPVIAAAGMFLVLLTGIGLAAAAETGRVRVIDKELDRATALAAAAESLGLAVVREDGEFRAGDVLVWEPRGRVDERRVEAVAAHVRRGGALLVSLGTSPDMTPMRLAFMLPTTGWQAERNYGWYERGPARVDDFDREFFAGPVGSVAVPWYYEVRPFHAVERGQARYDRYERPWPYLQYTHPGAEYGRQPAGTEWWTRPLLNRDWRVRARLDDVGASPLVLTGRYGAGRTAVLATTAALSESPANGALMAGILRWLTERPAAVEDASFQKIEPGVTVDRQARRIRIALTNPTDKAVTLTVLARLLTWEHAQVADVEAPAELPPNGDAIVSLPIPPVTLSSYQALRYRDAWDVRLGVLSPTGERLLHESLHRVDLEPPLTLEVLTDELRSVTWPFDAPNPNEPHRLGFQVGSYAYQPGEAVSVRLRAANGLRNLAPLASVACISDPSNTSVSALNDGGCFAERKSDWYALDAWGNYFGAGGKPNIVRFTMPRRVTMAAVVLYGGPEPYRNYSRRNPDTAAVLIDGREVARAEGLAERFRKEIGRVRIAFAPVAGTACTLEMANKEQTGLWLGEVEIEGTDGAEPPAVRSEAVVTLSDPLSGTASEVARVPIALGPLEAADVQVTVPVPAGGGAARFYRVEAAMAGARGGAPFMVLQPARPLASIEPLRSNDAINIGFIVTRGFRNVFETGTGTQEIVGGWGQPDDLVWAYSRNLKQLGARARTRAQTLYVSESDMRHYSTPWRDFCSGVYFWDEGAPSLVETARKHRNWKRSELVVLGFSDRWDTGPSIDALYGWQDFEGFDAWLRGQGKPGLKSGTREALAAQIDGARRAEWLAWQLERYVRAIKELRADFGAEGKRVVITAQGLNLLPRRYAAEVAQVVQGMSDDITWGQWAECLPLTTSRQMAAMAFNPEWRMSTLSPWGYNSATLNNAQWRGGVGTTEPSRRTIYDRAFRGTIRPDGAYGSMHWFGYNQNCGPAYTMNQNDYTEWARAETRHSLLTPDGPIGAGVILSTSRYDEGGEPVIGSMFDRPARGEQLGADLETVRGLVWRLQDAGVSVPFAANAGLLSAWIARGVRSEDTGLILADLDHWSESEIAALAKVAEAGVRLVAFRGQGPLGKAGEALFGGGNERPVVGGTRVSVRGPNMLIGRTALGLTREEAQALSPIIREHLRQRFTLRGATGYGFTSNGRRMIVVEDWREDGGPIEVVYRCDPATRAVRAVNLNDHTPLEGGAVHDGQCVFAVPAAPGDGVLIAVEELP